MPTPGVQLGHLLDHLRPGARILFVGINPGIKSAAVGHHFAGASNRFWKLLFESSLVNELLTYREDWRLPEWRLGLTNIIPRSSVGIDELHPREYQAGLSALERKVRRYHPRIIAFLGVTIIECCFLTSAEQGFSISARPRRGWPAFRSFCFPIPVDEMPTIRMTPCWRHFEDFERKPVHGNRKSCYLHRPMPKMWASFA